MKPTRDDLACIELGACLHMLRAGKLHLGVAYSTTIKVRGFAFAVRVKRISDRKNT